jgi:hypothetical protein
MLHQTNQSKRGRSPMSGAFRRLVHKRRLLVGVAILLPLVLAASGAEAAACKKVSGSFTITP